MMKIVALVQARMSSKRLPGKVLLPLGECSILNWVVGRVSKASLVDHTIVVTSLDSSDTILARHCDELNFDCFRGSLDDVASRFNDALDVYGGYFFVRVCGDSPFICPELIDRAIRLALLEDADLVTNVFPRTYPIGMSVEVIKSALFKKTFETVKCPTDREHICKFFYRNAANYRILNISNDNNYSNYSVAIDTKEDYRKISSLVKESHYSFDVACQEILCKFIDQT